MRISTAQRFRWAAVTFALTFLGCTGQTTVPPPADPPPSGAGDSLTGLELTTTSTRILAETAPVGLRVLARPSAVYVGETFELEIALIDRAGGLARGEALAVDLEAVEESSAAVHVPSAVEFGADDVSRSLQLTALEPGTIWLRAADPTGVLDADTSNPVWIRPAPVATGVAPPDNLYALWGDLHVHSSYTNDSESLLDPWETYETMIADGGLDFGAVTDKNGSLSEVDWANVKSAANAHACEHPVLAETCYAERRFVTLLGYEWTSWSPYKGSCPFEGGCYGHRNVFLYQVQPGDPRYVETGYTSIPLLRTIDPAYDEPCEIWESLEDMTATIPGLEFFTVPHHPGAYRDTPPRFDWSTCPEACGLSASYEPLVEIYSRHGSSEREGMVYPDGDPISCREDVVYGQTVQAALPGDGTCARHVGLIGSSDSQDGRPGRNPTEELALDNCPAMPLDENAGEWGQKWYRMPRNAVLCVYARGVSQEQAFKREKVFRGLVDRATYATTGARINLWFGVGVEGGRGHRMGQVLQADLADTVRAGIHVAQDGAPLDRITLLWHDPVAGWSTCREWNGSMPAEVDLSWEISGACAAPGTNIYYVRVEQEPDVVDTFHITELGRWIDVIGPDGVAFEVELAIGAYSASALADLVATALNDAIPASDPFTVAYLADDHRFDVTSDAGAFDVLWATGDHADTSVARLLGFETTLDSTGLDHYTSDHPNWSDGWTSGEMAWSSPIWITWF